VLPQADPISQTTTGINCVEVRGTFPEPQGFSAILESKGLALMMKDQDLERVQTLGVFLFVVGVAAW